jgi:predicted dehydrogenase
MAAAGQPTQAIPSLADLLRRPDVDAVAIATPNFLLAEHAIALGQQIVRNRRVEEGREM